MPEKGIRFPEAGVTGMSQLIQVLGTDLGFSGKAVENTVEPSAAPNMRGFLQ